VKGRACMLGEGMVGKRNRKNCDRQHSFFFVRQKTT
jgi:hypothetical protein